MHKLNRGPAPACLRHYQADIHQWSKGVPTCAEKSDIWACLDVMQRGRCAYCEAELAHTDKHIEHFRQRSRYPAGTFDWSNLFGSCNRSDSCGRHKDSCGQYNHADLVKPDQDDPDDYFVFVSDGTIAPRKGLSPSDSVRAHETLRVMNLDAAHGALRHMRRQAAIGYLQTAEEFQQFANAFDESEWRSMLDEELAAIANLPFVTTIRHALLGIRPS
ncbi:TIGR02646 family protein [Ahniella affigens]|uniref:TIGR02646 family protein n=1 Tax=Ahniella affigens TaxID=2021234 RepID=A0A2P1PMX1_9GAMM|nr:TIGR02646 family protein [Ahniella affigens]